MEFDIYSDESAGDALINKNSCSYSAIGGIWMPTEYRADFKQKIHALKEKHGLYGEMKWIKLLPKTVPFYEGIIDLFFTNEYMRFRVILIKSSEVDHDTFNNADSELGFYKFYYQLFKHWITDFNEYNIFLDVKTTRDRRRLPKLAEILGHTNLTSKIKNVQSLHSNESPGIQMADILTGTVSSKFNANYKSKAKAHIIEYIEKAHLGKPITHSAPWEEKFNVFKIKLQGGW